MEFRIEFHVEKFGDEWRATLADDFTEWGYGETPYEAIGNYCEQWLEWEEA